MLPAALRLRRSEDFATTIRGGARAGRRTLVVHCRLVDDRAGSRVGFVVARTVGGAVVRNKVRRRLRGVVLEERDSLAAGMDLVVRALPPSAEATYDELSSDFRSALGTATRRARAQGAR